MAERRHTGTQARRMRKPQKQAAHGDFGARLAGLRAAASLTQRELADRLGITRRQIAYYESGSGRPPGALLGVLADLFRVSTDVLLGRKLRTPAASRLSSAALARLQQIERMGGRVCRRLVATLDEFIVSERRRASARGRGAARRGA